MVVVLLVIGLMPAAQATVSGSNGRIAFRRYLNEAETHGAIFTIRPDGTGERRVTRPHKGFITTEPEWSPTGNWIAYHLEEAETERSKLFKIRPDGSHRRSLSGSCTGDCLGYRLPAWSPNGRRIAFVRESCSTGSDNLQSIYVMRSDGTRARALTHKRAKCGERHPLGDLAVQWAPGGRRLVLERIDQRKGLRAIFTVRRDGSGLHRLTPWKMDAASPDWSPNGRWIAFRSQEQSETEGNILLVHPGGGARHRITHSGGAVKWYSCTFSPNGKRITAAASPGVGDAGNADVYVMRTDGSGLRNVTRSAPWEGTPDWGPGRPAD
jgi:Tol biopolymer transport system component